MSRLYAQDPAGYSGEIARQVLVSIWCVLKLKMKDTPSMFERGLLRPHSLTWDDLRRFKSAIGPLSTIDKTASKLGVFKKLAEPETPALQASLRLLEETESDDDGGSSDISASSSSSSSVKSSTITSEQNDPRGELQATVPTSADEPPADQAARNAP